MVNFFNRRASDKRKPYTGSREAAANRASNSHDLEIPHFNSEVLSDQNQGELETAPSLLNPNETRPQVFTFMGATGGVGTTNLAVQVAYELAMMCKNKKTNLRRPKDPQVCLIDLDFEGGTCAYHLDLLPSLSVEDLLGHAERIDTTFTSALVSTHACGVSLLAVPNTPKANQKVNPHAVMAMLDAASQLYQYVIIDMPRYMHSWTPAVIGGSDFVGVVSELTISSLHMARDTLNNSRTALENNALGNKPNCHPILGKYERRSFKNTLRLNDAETVLGREVISTLCIDTDTCREAINCGEPVGAIRPDSRYVKDTRYLIKKIFKSCESRPNTADLQTDSHTTASEDLKCSTAA